MKRLALILIGAGLFLASCGTSRNTDSTTNDTLRSDTTTADTARMDKPVQ
ncbi:hypothetical protein [Pedobacter xixiisoli]|uniref:Uncharacterized protein n=1 Tax=Pedobacter xixiisoli TaxID=1476464 RepID=A0A285ZUF0_9SPHI|nr:hypothetical protein [Pedobacter xixiisoli]SOD13248.1 hypothetical protein SAMN06297358_1084 [Pedobacter xixiisoli]